MSSDSEKPRTLDIHDESYNTLGVLATRNKKLLGTKSIAAPGHTTSSVLATRNKKQFERRLEIALFR